MKLAIIIALVSILLFTIISLAIYLYSKNNVHVNNTDVVINSNETATTEILKSDKSGTRQLKQITTKLPPFTVKEDNCEFVSDQYQLLFYEYQLINGSKTVLLENRQCDNNFWEIDLFQNSSNVTYVVSQLGEGDAYFWNTYVINESTGDVDIITSEMYSQIYQALILPEYKDVWVGISDIPILKVDDNGLSYLEFPLPLYSPKLGSEIGLGYLALYPESKRFKFVTFPQIIKENKDQFISIDSRNN